MLVEASPLPLLSCMLNISFTLLTRSIRDSETSIDFVQGPPGSRRERVKVKEGILDINIFKHSWGGGGWVANFCVYEPSNH